MAGEAKVYILDIPYHADKAYSYYVPDNIEDFIVPGAVVEVPFGRGNRRMTGIVAEVTHNEPPMNVKPITSSVSDAPILSYEQLGLCKFVKEYTLCTFSEALRAMIPSAAMSKLITYYRLTSEEERGARITAAVREAIGDCGMQIVRFGEAHERFSRQTLQSEFDFNVRNLLVMLEKYGLIEKVVELKEKAAVKKKRILMLTENFASDASLDPELIDREIKNLRGANQQKLLRFLKDYGRHSVSELCEILDMKTPAVKSAAEALIKLGLVESFDEEDYRNHYSIEALLDGRRVEDYKKPKLNEEQSAAAEAIIKMCSENKPAAALLHGVTGSGKTAVIMEAIDFCIGRGQGVIMMIPEIALTPQTVGIFAERYGEEIAVIHSGLSAGERYDAWRRIRDGIVSIVIGTRSAVFAPLSNIGLIVIDEEHEYTYKSDTNPKYKTHDIARKRCADHNAVMLLASATPSVVSYYKAMTGAYTLIELKKRFGDMPLPKVSIVDMRNEAAAGNASPVSSALAEKLRSDKKLGNQSILFLNRRGYNNFISCRSCGKSVKCPNCSVTLTYHARAKNVLSQSYGEAEAFDAAHRENGYLTCHICGYRAQLPEKCPECGREHFSFRGFGTQKAEDDIASLFPDLRILRMDYDTTHYKYAHEDILDKFRHGEADVLLGTQMVTKGHDFPRVATVGVLDADNSLALEDFRAGERTFAMLTQVIGRAGRGSIAGEAVIQTYNPQNDVILRAASQDYVSFYESEIRLRKALCFPPFCDIAVITLSSSDEGYLLSAANHMHKRLLESLRDGFSDVSVVLFGPFEAPIYRVQNTYRVRFVLKCRVNRRTREMISELIGEFTRSTPSMFTRKMGSVKTSGRITVSVDLNPNTV